LTVGQVRKIHIMHIESGGVWGSSRQTKLWWIHHTEYSRANVVKSISCGLDLKYVDILLQHVSQQIILSLQAALADNMAVNPWLKQFRRRENLNVWLMWVCETFWGVRTKPTVEAEYTAKYPRLCKRYCTMRPCDAKLCCLLLLHSWPFVTGLTLFHLGLSQQPLDRKEGRTQTSMSSYLIIEMI